MRGALGLAVVCVVCGVGWFAVGSPLLGSASTAGELPGGFQEASLSGSPLVVAGASSLFGGEQARAQRAAELANPYAEAERELSETAYMHLNQAAAEQLANRAFTGVIDDPQGGPPRLAAGEKILSYISSTAAQIEFPDGKRGLAESLTPISVRSSPGVRVPIDLGLREVGNAIEPKVAAVGVRIPRRLADGVSMTSQNVTMTPVNERGVALNGAEGVVDGASVFYAGTNSDSDVVAKPVSTGFEEDVMLRAADAPHVLFFRLGLPVGASLRLARGSGVVRVFEDGRPTVSVIAPSAQAANGWLIPVSMTLHGDVLKLVVKASRGEYEYPWEVDPLA